MNDFSKTGLGFLKAGLIVFVTLGVGLTLLLLTPMAYRMATNTDFAAEGWHSNQGQKSERSPRERMASDVVDWLTAEQPTQQKVLERLGEAI